MKDPNGSFLGGLLGLRLDWYEGSKMFPDMLASMFGALVMIVLYQLVAQRSARQ